MASRNLILTLIAVAAACLGAVSAALAWPVHDPWLERFQVGQFRSPQEIVLEQGWPAGLLDPLSVDPGWRLGAARYFADGELPRGSDLVAWRLALPALGSLTAAQADAEQARRQWVAIEALAEPGAVLPDGWTPPPGPWRAALRKLQASRTWEQGDRKAAALLAGALVADAADLNLSPAEIFVWTLRAERLVATASEPAPSQSLWRRLHDLGLYDTRSGWAVWVVLQESRGLPALTPEQADRDTGVMLATAGQLWLTPTDLREAAFPPEIEAGLGGLLLPPAALADHFQRWPEPPSDGRFQGYWLRGQRRLQSGAANVERLAVLPGLVPGHRLDLWRRASEGRLLHGQWQPGLSGLEAGLALMDSEASSGMKDRLSIWIVQALALALAQQRAGDAATIVGLAEQFLSGDQLTTFQQDAGPLLSLMGRGRASAGEDLRGRSESMVLQGLAPPIERQAGVSLPDAGSWRHQLWEHWARWGLAVLGPDVSQAPRLEAYRLGLAAVLQTQDLDQRHATAVAVAAAHLRGSTSASPLIAWARDRDIERRADGHCLPRPSPLPDLRAPDGLTTLQRNLHDHALLGAALALGDDRGVLAMAVRLPAAGTPTTWRWPFWYPIPADPAVRNALAASDLPAELLLAIARNESLFDPAVRSRAGALGYMQIMPFHYQDPAGVSGPDHWRHPAASLQAGARILGDAVRRHGGDPYRSVAAYNAGSTAVERWDRQLGTGGSPLLYRAWISYPETRGYTLRVLRDREVYRALMQGGP